MIAAKSAEPRAGRMRRLLNWDAMPTGVRVLVVVLLLGMLSETIRNAGSLLDWMSVLADELYDGLVVGAAVLCVARAALRRDERLAWALMGVALALWAAGDIYWTAVLAALEEPPYPSLADAGYLGFLPVAYVAVVLLVRQRLPHLDARLWLDGVIAALTTGAVSAAVVFGAVQATTGGDTAAVATNLAYPLGDMILIAILIGAMTAGRGRLDRTWLFFGAGIATWTVADSIYLFQIAEGTYVVDGLLDLGWPFGALLIGLSAWQPGVARARPRRAPAERRHAGGARARQPRDPGLRPLRPHQPAGAGARHCFDHRDGRAPGADASREPRHIVTSRRQARTDSLTGLGNRFGLLGEMELRLADADAARAAAVRPRRLQELQRLLRPSRPATRCSRGSARGSRRRWPRTAAPTASAATSSACWAPGATGDPVEPLIARARAALCEEGEGFKVGASCGHALLSVEAHDAAEALRVADRRLYAEKNSGRVSARVQSARVLRRALDAWDAELGEHTSDVALLAAQVARRLGLDEDEVERIATGAELHDVGKIAIPRSILSKPAALDDEEWAFMRRHTLIGERIAQGAPALVGVAGLIRSSHERWDGGGYPDGLAGDAIPLGAQILFVCDSFSAMTTDRCYKPGMSEADATEELRRHAGSQFAPAVVDAFVAARDEAVGTLALGTAPATALRRGRQPRPQRARDLLESDHPAQAPVGVDGHQRAEAAQRLGRQQRLERRVGRAPEPRRRRAPRRRASRAAPCSSNAACSTARRWARPM